MLTSELVGGKQIGGGTGGGSGGGGGGIEKEEKEGGIAGGKGKDKNKKISNAVLKSQNDPKIPGVSDEEECSAETCLGELVECGETAAKVSFLFFNILPIHPSSLGLA